MSDLKFDAICNSVDEHPVSALRDDLSTRLYLEPRSTESERGHLTSLWKKGAGENLYVHALPSFLPSFLSFSPDPLRRRLIIVARQELELFSWPVTSATPPPSSSPASSPSSSLVSSLGGNFPAIRAHSLRLFLQAPFFLSQ